MTILRDDGLYRHIHVAIPGSSAYHFNITTFPGYLVFTGDMGAYTFSRERDMFDFHRLLDRRWNGPEGPTTDYRYWAEKCEAQDTRSGGTVEYDHGALEAAAKRDWRQHQKDDDCFFELSKRSQRRVAMDFRLEVLGELCSDDERQNYATIMNWEYEDDNGNTIAPFSDFWDHGSFKSHTFRFRWACWAIASTTAQRLGCSDSVVYKDAAKLKMKLPGVVRGPKPKAA